MRRVGAWWVEDSEFVVRGRQETSMCREEDMSVWRGDDVCVCVCAGSEYIVERKTVNLWREEGNVRDQRKKIVQVA